MGSDSQLALFREESASESRLLKGLVRPTEHLQECDGNVWGSIDKPDDPSIPRTSARCGACGSSIWNSKRLGERKIGSV